MRILLKFVIDCDADAAWRAMHSPAAVSELYGPLLQLQPLDPRGLPTFLDPGTDAPIRMVVVGVVSVGTQLIHATDRYVADSRGPVRILRDSGRPISGPLALLRGWEHQMAVAPSSGDPSKTLWRERLVIKGAAAPALWPTLWATWQWRELRIKQVAPTWAHDPETHPEAAPDADAAASGRSDDESRSGFTDRA